MDEDTARNSDVGPVPPSMKLPLQAKGKDKTATEMYQKVPMPRRFIEISLTVK